MLLLNALAQTSSRTRCKNQNTMRRGCVEGTRRDALIVPSLSPILQLAINMDPVQTHRPITASSPFNSLAREHMYPAHGGHVHEHRTHLATTPHTHSYGLRAPAPAVAPRR